MKIAFRGLAAIPCFCALLLAGCEDFLGDAFPAEERVAVDWLPGDWVIVSPGKADEAIRIERLPGESPAYLLLPAGENDRIVMRFTRKKGRLVGEYRASEPGGESESGVLIALEREGDGFLAFLADDLSAETVKDLGLRAEGRWYLRRYGNEPPDYWVLSGTASENGRAIDSLLERGVLFDFSPKGTYLTVRPDRRK